MKHTILVVSILGTLGACVDPEPELGEEGAELVTPGPRPKPLFAPDILWENGPSITYHSYLPPGRTTHDGRITFESESAANFKGRCFRLIRPEVLSGHLSTVTQEVGAALNTRFCLPQNQFHNTTFVFGQRELGIQGALCDAAPTQPPGRVDPRATNAQPQPCPGNPTRDCYTVTTITHMETPVAGVPEEVWSRPFRIEVSNPKTASASIVAVTPLATAVSSTQTGSILEPVVSGDGRVLVYHDGRDTKYAVNPVSSGFGPCDARGFSAAQPVSSMHTDNRMIPHYGLAKFQLRTSENAPVAAGTEVGGAYPWIDRDVSNLFITTAGSSLHYLHQDTNLPHAKYPVLSAPSPSKESPIDPQNVEQIRMIGDIGGRSGIMVMGLWTQGKMVVLDSRNNNSDLAILEHCIAIPGSLTDCAQPPIHDRMIDLYQNTPGGTRIGASNSFFINSPENVLNYDADLRPVTPRDVVWQLASTTGTDEVAFDDYLLTRALVISPMNAPVANTHPLLHERDYIDGFEHTGQFRGRGFTRDPHVQNAATSKHWNLPAYGLLQGGARIEPIAAGGVKGKGVWLDGNNDRITYTVPAQGQAGDMASSAWMYSLWINPTTALNATQRRLLTTPDGTELRLSATQLVAQRGSVTSTTTLPAALAPSPSRYTHLAVVSTPTALSIYVDGYLLATPAASSLLRMSAGTLTVGSATSGGFIGWIDEVKVVARAPNPEELCNHAYGTLVGVTSGMPGFTVAGSYPGTSHGAITSAISGSGGTYGRYYCESQKITGAAAGGSYLCKFSRSDARCVGRRVLIPEGPLQHGVPRPVTTGNTFCTSCHDSLNPSFTMQPAALNLRTTALEDDRRRQPMQPDPLLFGRIPAGLLGPGVPASTTTAPAAGYEIDPVTLPGGTLCVPSATTLCLMNRRFAVTLTFTDPGTGAPTAGKAIAHTPNTGHFWFFQNTNIEVTVKTLDGSTLNSRAWVFHSGITNVPYTVIVYDHFNKTSKNYPSNPPSGEIVCGVQDTNAFLFNAPMGAIDGVTPGPPLGPPPSTGGNCVPGPGRLCALNRRYEVTARFRNSNNVMQAATVRGEQTDQSGFFTFFNPDNLELLVKVIDGTPVNGKIWLFYGSLTSVVYDITLRDTVVPRQVTFTSTTGPQGQQCGRLATSAL